MVPSSTASGYAARFSATLASFGFLGCFPGGSFAAGVAVGIGLPTFLAFPLFVWIDCVRLLIAFPRYFLQNEMTVLLPVSSQQTKKAKPHAFGYCETIQNAMTIGLAKIAIIDIR